MSNGNNRNDEMNDYLDLLNRYSKDNNSEAISLAEKKKEKSVSVNTSALEDVVDEDFFEKSNTDGKNDINLGDINRFFEGTTKKVPEKTAHTQMSKKPSPPPISGNGAKMVNVNKTPAAPKAMKTENEENKGKNSEVKSNFSANALKKTKIGNKSEEETQDNMDVSSNSKQNKEKNPFKRLLSWYKALTKKKKILVGVIAAILAVIIVLVSVAGIFVRQKFDIMGDNMDNPVNDDDIIYENEEIENIEIDIGSAGFKQSLIDWATTGNDKHMSSKNVINVLLIGADSRKGKNEGNTDVMMLVSVNRKTKTLKMVSFLRDSYLYIEGDNNSYCTKLNAAYSMGGPECLIETIENNYKIEIDNFVMVNFESFKHIVDKMGGITVDVQGYEANAIENDFKISMPSGDGVTLNGKQALAFCRIRHCDADGDVSRTRRQRQVIDSMVDRVISSSISEINGYIDVLLPYVDTGYSQSEIISLGIKAITGGWAKYERSQLSAPSSECRTSGSANMWIWVVDYQKAAHDLQMELYGTSNIELSENRITIIDVYNGANYSGSSATINDNNKNNEPEVDETTEKTTEKTTTVNNKTTSPQTEETKEEKTTENVTEDVENTTTESQTTLPETTESSSNEPTAEDSADDEEIGNDNIIIIE